MTDEILAQEWWGNLSPDEIGNVQLLTALLARVRMMELKSLLTLVHGTQQHIPLTVPEKCQFQICVDINSRIRSLASGAEEKK